jgi:hypothetical protein
MRRGRQIAILGIAALVMISLGCGGTGQSASPSAKGILSFEDDGASWITTGNHFAQVLQPTTPTWFGVLFQFGRFTDNPFTGKVRFLDKDNNPVAAAPLTDGWLDQNQFTWINIVSRREGVAAPLLPNQAQVLFPNSIPNACDMGGSGNNCLRDRRIHWDQKPISFIITYWDGGKGFNVDSKVKTDPGKDYGDRNALSFQFRDDFEVTVYKMSASNEMEELVKWGVGEVKTIKIENIEAGTPHGGKHCPPWIQ